MRKPRSVYLGESHVQDIQQRAERYHRSFSGQLCWLICLGLIAHKRGGGLSDSMDDGQGRHYFYPPEDLDAQVLALASDGRAHRYSSVVRSLLLLGATLEDHLFAQI